MDRLASTGGLGSIAGRTAPEWNVGVPLVFTGLRGSDEHALVSLLAINGR